nr:proline-rich protein 36-like [Taeniopygia guttata]
MVAGAAEPVIVVGGCSGGAELAVPAPPPHGNPTAPLSARPAAPAPPCRAAAGRREEGSGRGAKGPAPPPCRPRSSRALPPPRCPDGGSARRGGGGGSRWRRRRSVGSGRLRPAGSSPLCASAALGAAAPCGGGAAPLPRPGPARPAPPAPRSGSATRWRLLIPQLKKKVFFSLLFSRALGGGAGAGPARCVTALAARPRPAGKARAAPEAAGAVLSCSAEGLGHGGRVGRRPRPTHRAGGAVRSFSAVPPRLGAPRYRFGLPCLLQSGFHPAAPSHSVPSPFALRCLRCLLCSRCPLIVSLQSPQSAFLPRHPQVLASVFPVCSCRGSSSGPRAVPSECSDSPQMSVPPSQRPPQSPLSPTRDVSALPSQRRLRASPQSPFLLSPLVGTPTVSPRSPTMDGSLALQSLPSVPQSPHFSRLPVSPHSPLSDSPQMSIAVPLHSVPSTSPHEPPSPLSPFRVTHTTSPFSPTMDSSMPPHSLSSPHTPQSPHPSLSSQSHHG